MSTPLGDVPPGNAQPAGKDDAPAVLLAGHVRALLYNAVVPELPAALAPARDIHEYLIALRDILLAFSNGDLSHDIKLRGVIAGRLKALQANLLHLTWQIEQVANGDFSQRIEFMGRFSDAFECMVRQLDDALGQLRAKERQLIELTLSLKNEVDHRGQALRALRESEKQLRYLAEHDPMTGVLNRRSFFSLAEMEARRSAVAGESCCFAILDVDHFKNFNDTYGHLNGDLALKHLTGVAKAALRQADVMGRYGGEEFVFFFGGADLGQGLLAAERIRQAVAGAPVTLEDGRSVSITVSIGLACLSPPEASRPGDERATVKAALRRADAALYEAKTAGRDRVAAAPDHA